VLTDGVRRALLLAVAFVHLERLNSAPMVRCGC